MATITVTVGADTFEVTVGDNRATNGAARFAESAGIDPLRANGNPKPVEKVIARAAKRLLIQASKSTDVAEAADRNSSEAQVEIDAIDVAYGGELAEGVDDE